MITSRTTGKTSSRIISGLTGRTSSSITISTTIGRTISENDHRMPTLRTLLMQDGYKNQISLPARNAIKIKQFDLHAVLKQ